MIEILEPEVKTEPDRRPPSYNDGGDGGNFDDGNHGNGGDGDHGCSSHTPRFSVDTDVLGMLVFIASELILFLVLIVAFAWLRSGYPEWPPPGQPRLPLLITFINTLILLASACAMYRAWRHILDDYVFSDHRWLMITWMLGTVFLIIQGFEWIRLIGYGLNATANLYGAMFYIIIGAHGLHVFVAVQALLIVWRRALRGLYTRRRHNGVVLAGLFWGFVALIWPVLFVFVYL